MIPFLSLRKVTEKYRDELHDAILRVVDSGWYLRGEEVRSFEAEYARYIGSPYCVACGNGLDALTLILRAYKELGVMKDGDEVIVPANTYIASVLAITENNLVPVLVEPRFDTLEIDDDEIEQHITDRTRAIMIVHLYGRCAYTEKIGELCKKYNLKLIEDNAQAQGCKASPTGGGLEGATGSLGDASGHSFYPGKNIGALGDAGAVTCRDKELAEMVRMLANYGAREKYMNDYKGRNSRMDEIQAAVLRVKLRHLDEDNNHRRWAAHYYEKHISNSKVMMPIVLPDEENVYHIFPVFSEKRDELQKYLRDNDVETLIHYPIALNNQKCLSFLKDERFPISERIAREELSLPIGPTIDEESLRTVCELINKF